MTTKQAANVILIAGACSLHAAERVWNGADGANWADPDVWTISGVPATAPENTDTVTINNGTTVNLTGAALTDTNRFAEVKLNGNSRGTLVVGPGGYLPCASLRLSPNGTGPNTPGRIIVDGGYVNGTSEQHIGEDNINQPGRLEIINGGSYTSTGAFRAYNGSVLVSNSSFNATFTTYLHGSSATGLFEIVDSTVNMTALAIGREVQNGNGKTCLNVLRMRSGALNMSGTLEVGHTGMSTASITGVVEQAGGAVTLGGGSMISMPVNTYATGFYHLNGGRLSLLNTGDSMRLGGRDMGGKGYFNMTDGVLTNKGTLYLGTATGGYGRFEQSGGYSFFEKTILVGASTNATGDLNLLGGTLTLSGGANINVGNFSNALGRCYVGDGLLNAAGRTLYIGSASFSSGRFVQNDGIVSNSTTVIGSAYASSGTLIVSNGLFISAGGMNVGSASNAIGRCEVDGGLLSLNGAITLGVASNSVGSFVLNGGTVSNTSFSAGNILTTTGSVEITGGQLYSAGEFYFGNGSGGPGLPSLGGVGRFSMSDGKLLTTGRFILGAYGSAYGALSGGEVEALASGRTDQCVVLGRDTGTFGRLEMTGGVLKGTNELVLARDPGSTGLVYVAGGDLYFNAIRRSTGFSVFNLAGGTLHPYNRDTAFSFNGSLTNDIGYGDTGTVFGFSPVDKDGAERTMSVQGVFTGNGGLAKRGTGTVTLGGTLTYTGNTVVESGTLALSNNVPKLASGLILVQANAMLDVSEGRSSAFVITNQTLAGAGTVAGEIRSAGGAVISGGTANAPAVLTINGDLTLDAGGTLLFNMLGGVYGRVHVTGNLTLPASANLTVNGAVAKEAEGQALLTWGGSLNMPTKTLWTVDGENDPFVAVTTSTRSLVLSYRRGTLFTLK